MNRQIITILIICGVGFQVIRYLLETYVQTGI